MSIDLVYYLATLAVYFLVYAIFTLGLDIQFGQGGILNFAYYTFIAVGAYTTGVLTLGPANSALDTHYVLGLRWSFLPAMVVSGLVTALLGFLVGLVALRRLRSDYLAIVIVAFAEVSLGFVSNFTPLFNGYEGLYNVPQAFNDILPLNPDAYILFFVAVSLLVACVFWIVAVRIRESPFSRTLRAIRDDADVAAAYGKNVFVFRMLAMVIGSAFAGVGGSLLISFIGAFSPAGWSLLETFVIWIALLLGGRGRPIGAILGALLVPVVFLEVFRFLPAVPGHPDLVAAARNISFGLILILTLRIRPQGILAERRKIFREPALSGHQERPRGTLH